VTGRAVEQVEERDQQQRDDDPKREVFRKIQGLIP
jgi:hypothetical protein